MISIGIIYHESSTCPDAHKRFQYMKQFDQPTHFIEIPKDCTLSLLQKILENKLLSCHFDPTKTDAFALNLQFKCLRPLFEKECAEDPFEYFQNTMIAENNGKIEQNKWIEIPHDYIALDYSIINNPFLRIDTQHDFILVKQRGCSNVQPSADLEISDVHIGDIVDAMDQQNKWYQAIVINKYFERIYLHFIGWSSRWNEWISNRNRLHIRFSFSKGPHCTHLVTYSTVVEQHEKSIIQQCTIKAANTYKTMFNFDFSSLITEVNHREIILTCNSSCLDDNVPLAESASIKVHRCVLCMWSPSFAILCQKDYGMKDCDSGIIELPTQNLKIVKLFSEWIYLSSTARMQMENSAFYTLDMVQLMDLYIIAEMHCIDELTFIVIQMITVKMKKNPNVILYDMLTIKHFIRIRMDQEEDAHKDYKFHQLYAAFMVAVRSIELIDIKIILLNHNNAQLQLLGVDEEKTGQCEVNNGELDEVKADDICWLLSNIGCENTFDEWFAFVIKWIFVESTNQWFDAFGANERWKCILNEWWIFLEKKDKNQTIQISPNTIKNAKQNIHQLYDDLDAERLSNDTKSDLFEWLLSLIINQWDLMVKKNN